MDSAIEPLKALAARIGAEQQKANDAIMKEITTRASQLFDSLTTSREKLVEELVQATAAVATFKAGLLEDVEGPIVGKNVTDTKEASIRRLSGGDNVEQTFATLQTGPLSQAGFSVRQMVSLQDEIKKLADAGIKISIDEILRARQQLIKDAGFDPNDNASIRRLQESRNGGIRFRGINPTINDPNAPSTFTPNYETKTGNPFAFLNEDYEFADGGMVPGQGNRDSVEAMLTPGEFVMTKKATKAIGAARLSAMNKRKGFANGGLVGGSARGGFTGSIEMPSFGDLIDNVDKVFQTYDDGASKLLDKRISETLKESDTKVSSHLIDLIQQQLDLKALLILIARATDVTAKVLLREQGPNSFNVYDKTGDKNASETTKKLTDIERASAANSPAMMPETTVAGRPGFAGKPTYRKTKFGIKPGGGGDHEGFQEAVGASEDFGYRPPSSSASRGQSRGTMPTAPSPSDVGAPKTREGLDRAWKKYNEAMDIYESGGFQGDAPRAPNEKGGAGRSSRRSSGKGGLLQRIRDKRAGKGQGASGVTGTSGATGASGTFFVSTEMNEMRSPPSRSAFDSDTAGTTKKDPPKTTIANAKVGGIPQPTGFSSEFPKFRTGDSSPKEPRFRPPSQSVKEFESNDPGTNALDELELRAQRQKALNDLQASTVVQGTSGPARSATPMDTTFEDARNRIKEENRLPDSLEGRSSEETSKLSASNFELIRAMLVLEGSINGVKLDPKDITDAMVRSRIMQDASPEQRVEKVVNEMLSANMIEGGEFGGAQRASGMQAMVDQMRNDPSVGLQSDKEKLAAEVAFRDRAAREGIASGPVGMSMKEKTDRLEARTSNVLRKRTQEGVTTFGGGEQAKRDAATEERMKGVKLKGLATGRLDERIPGLGQAVQEGRTNFGRSGAITTTGLSQGTSRATTGLDAYRDIKDLEDQRKFGRGMSDDDLTFDVLGLGGKGKTSLDFGQKEKDLKLLQANSRERTKRQNELFDEFQKQGAGKEENRVRGFGGSLSPQMSQEEYDKQFAEIEGSSFLGNKFMTAGERTERLTPDKYGNSKGGFGKFVSQEARRASEAKADAREQQYNRMGVAPVGSEQAALLDADMSAATTARVQMSNKEKAAEYLRSQSSFNLPDVTAENITDEQVSSAIRQKQAEAKNKVLQDSKDKFKAKPPAPKTTAKTAAERGDEKRAKIKADIAEKNRPDRLYDDKARDTLQEQFEKGGMKSGEAKEKAQKEVDKRRLKQEALDQLNPAARRSYEQGRSKLPIDENVETKVKELEEKRAEKRAADQAAKEARKAQEKADKKAKKKANNQPSWRNLWGMAGGGGGGGAQPTSLLQDAAQTQQGANQPAQYAGGRPPRFDTIGPPDYRSGAHALDGAVDYKGGNATQEAGGRPPGMSDADYASAMNERPKPGKVYPDGSTQSIPSLRNDTPGGGPRAPQEAGGLPIYPKTNIPSLDQAAGMATGGPAGGAGAGIMGPDAKAIAAMNNLATALNGVSGGIEIKITEPVEVKLDSGSLIPKIKEIVTEAVKNSAGNAAVGNGNSQMISATVSSPTQN